MTAENQSNGNGECPFFGSCSLIQKNQTRMPNLVQRIQDYYCTGESLQCARRWIYDTLGQAFVPPLLLPNQWEWARQIATETEENCTLPKLDSENSNRV
ncbi:MAG: hypothetical protein ACYSTR_04080 [Planctomycetota bacterium]|jgi:hypothetical protein